MQPAEKKVGVAHLFTVANTTWTPGTPTHRGLTAHSQLNLWRHPVGGRRTVVPSVQWDVRNGVS